jgi:salicylate hydroxylase
VQTNKKLVSTEQDGMRVAAFFADDTRANADILIAADGTRSTVRKQLFDDTPPQFASQVAFRCLIPRDAAAPFIAAGNAVVSVGAGRIFHRYVLRGGSLVNIVGIARSNDWREEGWNKPATTDEFLAQYRDFHPDVTGLIARAPSDSLIKWGLFVRPPIPNWSIRCVALLGDAAHPILPFLGLGAALAIEDGVVLARAMEATSGCEAGLKAYQAARFERVEHVRVQSIRQGEVIQATDPDHFGLTHSPSQNVTLFDYDPCSVPIDV